MKKKTVPKLSQQEIDALRQELEGKLEVLRCAREEAEKAFQKVIQPLWARLRKLQDACSHPNLERYPGGESCALCGLHNRF